MSSPSAPGAAARFVAWQRDYNGITEHRLGQVERLLGDLGTFVGGSAEQATGKDFAAWMTTLAESGLHPNTVRKYGNMVRPFFKWAWRDGLISGDTLVALGEVPNPRGSSGESRPRPYSRKEIARFWAELDAAFPKAHNFVKRWRNGRSRYPRVWRHAMGLQIEAIAMLMLHAGMRREEVFRATIDDIHPDNAYVVVHGAAKGDGASRDPKLREVPMTVELRRALAEWLSFRALLAPSHDRPWLVLHPKASPNSTIPSSPVNPMSWRKFGTLMADVGAGWEMHRLRHTCATEWLRAGMPLENVKDLMGHSRIQQTMAYTKIIPQDTERHARRAESDFTKATARPSREAA